MSKKGSKGEQKETTSESLFRHLFGACDILRGPINQDEYKTYVTPILFFKRLSDVYDEETITAMEESDGDGEYAQLAENHSFIIPNGCHWDDVRDVSENVGVAIVKAMTCIERANPDTLFGVFSSFDDANWTDKNKLSDERLKNLVEHMSALKVGNGSYPADVMGDAYEYLIKKFADMSKKNAGEYYTPRSIVRMMVKLIAPVAGETVYDPACGTGGMLIEAIRHMHDDKLTYGRIYGQEKNLSTSAIARMNLFLHGAKDFNIAQGDTLRSPSFLSAGQLKTFDCVLANPPFSLKKWGAEQFSSDAYGRNMWGDPPDSSADFAWLQHMVKSMDPINGRLAVVLPQGVLFHDNIEKKIRVKLIQSDRLEYVITLAKGVFFRAGVSACILILNNKKGKAQKGKVCMIDASEIYTAQRAQNIMSENDTQRVYDLCFNFQDVVEEAKVVYLQEIADNDYSLEANHYILRTKPESISPVEIRTQFTEKLREMHQAEEELIKLLRDGGYLDK